MSDGPVSIRCPICGDSFPVPTDVLGVDGHQVIARMDRSGLYGHMEACTPNSADQQAAMAKHPAGKALAAPGPQFVAKGKRACTMCGTANAACMELTKRRHPCCGPCGDGNTHPAPQSDVPCREWASEHGAPH